MQIVVLIISVIVFLPALGRAQAAGNAPDPKHPPVSLPPGVSIPRLPPQAPPEDIATRAINPAVRARVDAAHGSWKATSGGAEFQPGLNYVGGRPILMLVTRTGESGLIQSRRTNAIVSACEFLLDTGAFDRAVICVVEFDPNGSATPAARNTEISREHFEASAKTAGKSTDLKAALAKVRGDAAAIGAICADLGIR